MNMKELVEDFMKASDVDYVGLWEIAHAAREDLHARSTDEARLVSLQIVRQLYEEGLRPGDYNLGTRFDYWPDEGCQAMLDRIPAGANSCIRASPPPSKTAFRRLSRRNRRCSPTTAPRPG
jgi:hypothetical protein